MADYHDERLEHFSLPDPRLPRVDVAGPWPFPDPQPPTTNRVPSAAQLGAVAVAGALTGVATPPPPRSVPRELDEIEAMLEHMGQRVGSVRYALLGEGQPRNERGGAPDVYGRLVLARGELSDIMGDLSAIELALGLREG